MLRRFSINDADEMFRTWTGDEDVARYMRWDAHKDVGETKQVITVWLKNYERNDFYLWGITLKDTNTLIGTMGMFCANENDMCYEVAYCTGKAYWNNGYVSEALKAVINFGLQKIGINRIEAYHSINNPASGKVMQKCGMQYEGRARQKYKSHAGFEDCDMYAILREDLKVNLKENIK
jgi:Acetyltransferases, including N-acetylases of ribosomal proteins